MLEKALSAIAGLVVLATVIFVAVVAAALALFFALTGPLGPGWAAAIVFGVFALFAVLMIVVVAMKGRGGGHEEEVEEMSFTQRLIGMAKERPILSAGAAIAALLIAIRNPALVATIAAAFMDRPKK